MRRAEGGEQTGWGGLDRPDGMDGLNEMDAI